MEKLHNFWQKYFPLTPYLYEADDAPNYTSGFAFPGHYSNLDIDNFILSLWGSRPVLT